MRAVLVVQFVQGVLEGQLDGLDGILRGFGGKGADKPFDSGCEDMVLHTQNVIGFFQIFEALFDAAHDSSFGIC